MNILTTREVRLLAFVLAAVALGAGVKAWRENRLAQPAIVQTATP